jgi:hypothetical protein
MYLHELILGLVPRNDAAKMGTDGVKSEVGKVLLVIEDKVSGITLKTLDELAGARAVGVLPALNGNVVTKGILSNSSTSASARASRNEEGKVRDGKAKGGNTNGTDKDGVHGVTAGHVRYENLTRASLTSHHELPILTNT